MKGVDNTQLMLVGVVSIIGLVVYFDIKSGVKKTAKAVGTAINPMDANNLASKGARAVLGEDFVIDKIGGGVAKVVDWLDWGSSDKPKATPLKR